MTLGGSGFNFVAGDTIIVSGFHWNTCFLQWDLGYSRSPAPTGTSVTYTDSLATSNTSQSAHTASWGTCAFQLTQLFLN